MEAVQPRFPCFKLGLKFQDAGMVERFLDSERWGVYFRVVTEGSLRAGDSVDWERRDPARYPVPELLRLMLSEAKPPEKLMRALSAASLPPEWRAKITELLRRSTENS